MTEWHEGPRDIEATNALMAALAPLWRITHRRMPEGSPYNFTCYPVEHPQRELLMSLSCRNYTMDQVDRWGGVFYQRSQWQKIKQMAANTPDLVLVVVPQCAGQNWAMATTTFEYDDEKFVNPVGRNDRHSNAWCVMLKKHRFRPVTAQRPWEQQLKLL